jgi:transposase-like protein
MAQHFLLNAAARTLSLKAIFRMSEDEAFETFKALRWPDGVACPFCDHNGKMYFTASRRVWQCGSCRRQFRVTTETIFAHHKLPLREYLAAIALFTNGAKGYSALQMSRDLDVQYKTAYVLCHKIREAIGNHVDQSPMTGEVEVDASYFGGYVKPANQKYNRVDRRLAENQNGQRRAVLAFRQRDTENGGASRTRVLVVRSENPTDAKRLALLTVSPDAVVSADEHRSYNGLGETFTMMRVNHSEEYSNPKTGANINQCESFFSRMERCHMGQHHHMAPKYLDTYATEMAFREDTCRWTNGAIFNEMGKRAMNSGVSPDWCGYWQGNHRQGEKKAG